MCGTPWAALPPCLEGLAAYLGRAGQSSHRGALPAPAQHAGLVSQESHFTANRQGPTTAAVHKKQDRSTQSRLGLMDSSSDSAKAAHTSCWSRCCGCTIACVLPNVAHLCLQAQTRRAPVQACRG